jgi:Tol biopolymer transport system component
MALTIAAATLWLSTGFVAIDAQSIFADAQVRRITDWEGTESAAAISPDGRFVAFLADKAGEFDVYLNQLDTDRFVNLTADSPALAAPGPSISRLGFSGDGTHVWFTQGTRQWLLPITGGSPRPFLADGAAAPAWSHDGHRLVFFTNRSGDPLSIANASGADAREIALHADSFGSEGMHNHNPIWAADDRTIYFLHGPGSGTTFNLGIWRVPSTGGTPQRVTPQTSGVSFLAAVDAQTLIYIARDRDGSGPWLWTLDAARKTTRRVVTGLERYTSISASADGRRAVATRAATSASLWTVPLVPTATHDQYPEQYQLVNGQASAPRFHGTSVFYISQRGTRDAVWRHEDGRALEIWNGVEGVPTQPPAVSPDGRRVAVAFTFDGRPHLSVIAADGTGRQLLSEGFEPQGSVDWSPDGKWIVTGGRDAQGEGLFKIDVDERTRVRIVTGVAVNPVWSRDSRLIIYNAANTAGETPILGVTPDGEQVPLPPMRARRAGHRFLPDGTGLIYSPGPDFWILDFKTNQTRQITRFADRTLWVHRRSFDVTPDGKHLVFDLWREDADVVLFDLPK